MKAVTRSPAYPPGPPDPAATAGTDAAHRQPWPHNEPPGTGGTLKPPAKSITGGPLAGLSKTGLGVVLPERALHLPAMESLAAPARLLPRTRPASADAVRRALLTAFWGSHGAPEDYAEQQLLNQLRSHKPAVPMPCILFTDPTRTRTMSWPSRSPSRCRRSAW